MVGGTNHCNRKNTQNYEHSNPGKLSYTYWRGFERYDQAWGLSTKYTETLAKVSKEALELDRQYKIRQKTLRYAYHVFGRGRVKRESGTS